VSVVIETAEVLQGVHQGFVGKTDLIVQGLAESPTIQVVGGVEWPAPPWVPKSVGLLVLEVVAEGPLVAVEPTEAEEPDQIAPADAAIGGLPGHGEHDLHQEPPSSR
jgi:hypothetical protein